MPRSSPRHSTILNSLASRERAVDRALDLIHKKIVRQHKETCRLLRARSATLDLLIAAEDAAATEAATTAEEGGK